MSSGLYGLMEQAATKVLDRTTFADILTASVESIDPLTLTRDETRRDLDSRYRTDHATLTL
jgi:hypothetical protein